MSLSRCRETCGGRASCRNWPAIGEGTTSQTSDNPLGKPIARPVSCLSLITRVLHGALEQKPLRYRCESHAESGDPNRIHHVCSVPRNNAPPQCRVTLWNPSGHVTAKLLSEHPRNQESGTTLADEVVIGIMSDGLFKIPADTIVTAVSFETVIHIDGIWKMLK